MIIKKVTYKIILIQEFLTFKLLFQGKEREKDKEREKEKDRKKKEIEKIKELHSSLV